MSLLPDLEKQTQPLLESVPRDRWGRPLIVPPDGGDPISYTRTTTYVGALEDRYGLEKWSERMVARGLINRADLRSAVAANYEDDKEVNKICVIAKESAGSGAAAQHGSAVHKLSEKLDIDGTIPSYVEDAVRKDLNAYSEAMQDFTVVAIEQFVVLDDIKVAGTFDRIVELDGKRYIADIKTGNVSYGAGKIAMQLACYSRGVLYDHNTRERTPMENVDQNNGLVIHLPAGEASCTLYWINLNAGWESVALASKVRDWRKRRDLMSAFRKVG